MHVVQTIFDSDGASETLPPQEITSEDAIPAANLSESFDTEKEAMACYSDYKPQSTFLFTADCHMKRRTWTNSTLLQGDATAALSKLMSDALALGSDPVRTFVIGGDLFDNNRPASQDLVDVARVIGMFCRTFYIRGNHDSVKPSYLEAIKDQTEESAFGQVIDIESGYEKDVAYAPFHRLSNPAYITGIPWMPSDSQLVELFKEVVNKWVARNKPDDTLYLVMHCSFKHLLGFDGAYQLDADMVKSICGNNKINILVGHIHTRDTTVYNDVGAYIHSPGSIYPLSSDKMMTPCYGSLIDADTGHIIDIPCSVRKYVTLNVSEVDDIMAHLTTNNLLPADWRELPTFVNLVVPEDYKEQLVIPETDKAVFKIDRRLAARQVTVTSGSRVYTIQDAVREEVQSEANRDMVLEMAEELLSSDDPVATLDEWLTFWQVRKSPC